MKSCHDYQGLISRLLDGELGENESADVQRHIAGCPDCAAVYEAFRSLSDALAGDLVEAPEALQEKIMADVRREKLRTVGRPRRAVWTLAACLALVLLAAASLPRLLRMGSPAMNGSAAQDAVMYASGAGAEAAPQAPAGAPVPAPEEARSADVSEEYEAAMDSAASTADGAAPESAESIEYEEEYVLDEEQSRVLLSLLEDARSAAGPGDEIGAGRQIRVVYLDGGQPYGLTLSLCGDEIFYRRDDGSGSGRVNCGIEELFALFG